MDDAARYGGGRIRAAPGRRRFRRSVDAETGLGRLNGGAARPPPIEKGPGRYALALLFVESALSIQGGRAALARSSLRRHLAEIVALTDHHADMANDVVGGRAVELHLQHREMIQVVLRLELARLAADRDCNL